MQPPRAADVGHDLRNLVGLLRALSTDLGRYVGALPDDVREIALDLDLQSRFAMDALRVLEKMTEPSALEVNLGAWAWALRLWRRTLDLSDLSGVGNARLVVPEALDAGLALVDALGSTRRVSVGRSEAGVVFAATSTVNDADLAEALRRLRGTGLDVAKTSGPGTRVHVRPPRP